MSSHHAELRHLSASDELVLDKRLEPASVLQSLALTLLLLALLAAPWLLRPAVDEVARVAALALGSTSALLPAETSRTA